MVGWMAEGANPTHAPSRSPCAGEQTETAAFGLKKVAGLPKPADFAPNLSAAGPAPQPEMSAAGALEGGAADAAPSTQSCFQTIV